MSNGLSWNLAVDSTADNYPILSLVIDGVQQYLHCAPPHPGLTMIEERYQQEQLRWRRHHSSVKRKHPSAFNVVAQCNNTGGFEVTVIAVPLLVFDREHKRVYVSALVKEIRLTHEC